MIAITSVSPTHINSDQQIKAVKSWIDCGMQVYSMNCESECELLKDLYPDVIFISTTQTMQLTFKKPYVRINAVLDWCKEQDEDNFCIINSDIELKINDFSGIEKEMESAIVLANRIDYEVAYSGSQYTLGIDVFFIHKKWLYSFSQTIFCFGQCFWDYWIPYSATKKGIEVTFIKQDIAFHKTHNAQYNHDQWLQTARYFLWEHGLYNYNSTLVQDLGRMNKDIYNYIYTAGKRKEL